MHGCSSWIRKDTEAVSESKEYINVIHGIIEDKLEEGRVLFSWILLGTINYFTMELHQDNCVEILFGTEIKIRLN